MVTLEHESLCFRFPEIHPSATLTVTFMRTLRVPDDGKTYPLPAGIDTFPMRHIEDYKHTVPKDWLKRGGVLLPMYQSEALWINFSSSYPMALKIGAGKINAVTGKSWTNELSDSPQDYIAVPTQPWLDGFKTHDDSVNQFVAVPLGHGATAEEQITGSAEFGGIQIIAFPLKREVYDQEQALEPDMLDMPMFSCCESSESASMGLGLGGKIEQKIYEDDHAISDWETTGSRCFVHLVNSQTWQSITTEAVPHPPISKDEYIRYGIPWFDLYDDGVSSVKGSETLANLKTTSAFSATKPADNTPIDIASTIVVNPHSIVTDGDF